MATLKRRVLKGRLPRVVPKPPTKAPIKAPAKKRAPTTKRVAGASTLRQRVDRTLDAIVARIEKVDTEYYEIGQAIMTLDEPEIWSAYGLQSFAKFIDEHIMPYSTARRLITVATEYTKQVAKQIGLERGFQLDRLTRNDPDIKRSPQQLWQRNALLGPARKKMKVRDMSAADIAALVQQALLRTGRTRKAKPTTEMKQSATTYKKSVPYKTRVRFDLKKKDVVIRVSLEDFLEHY